MEDQELRQKLAVLEQKIDAAFRAAEQTRKYLLWTLIITVVMVALPAIGLVFVIPSFISTYSTTLSQFGGL